MSTLVPRGFRLAGVHCGLKADPDQPDISLIVADSPAAAAGVYTTNQVVAAPVIIDRARTPSNQICAVVVNSGNANACTGEQGIANAHRMTQLTADAIGADAEQVLVMSTGIIGEHLDMNKISRGIQNVATRLSREDDSFIAAARGMMTTDKSHKVAQRRLSIAGRSVQLAGMAKGAGMIGPRMATMLGVIMTDAAISPSRGQAVLTEVVEKTFNCISVEGHTSTNDTVLMLCSGLAGGEQLGDEALTEFRQGLLEVCTELARAIPNDGEGASHLIEIGVSGCRTREDARQIARTIADSPLVKTGIAGADPNWGRIVSAAGYAGVPINPDQLELSLNGTLLFRDGEPVEFDTELVSDSIRNQRETKIVLRLNAGSEGAHFWTSDLTAEYIRINADYHT